MSKYRYGLTTFGFLLVIIFSCIFCDYFCGIVDGGIRHFSIMEIITISLAILIPSLVYYVQEKKLNRAKPNWIVFILLFLLMGSGIYGIWATPNGITKIGNVTFDYQIDLLTRISWTLGLIFTFITFYLMSAIWSKRFASHNWLRAIYFIVILVGFASIIYSLVFDKGEYDMLFKGEDNFYPYINSFFENKNTFGQFMLFCVISVVVLDAIKPHWWHILYFLSFLTFTFFSTSFTAIVISHFIVIAFYIYKLAITYKKHPIRNSLCLGLTIFVIVGIVGGGIILYYANYKPVFRFGNFLVDVFDKDFQTATSRTKVWQAAIETLQTPMQWAFGYGYRNFNLIFHNYYQGNSLAVDNTFVQLVGSFGLVGITIYFILMGLFGFTLIYPITKKKTKISIPLLIISIAMIVYSIFESAVIFEAGLVGLLLYLMIILPGLIEYNKTNPDKDTVRVSLLKNTSYEFPKKWDDVTVATFVSFFLVILEMMFILSNSYSEIGVGIIFVLFLSWLSVPSLFGIWSKAKKGSLRLFLYIFLTLLIYGIPFLGTLIALHYHFTFKAAAIGYVAFFMMILAVVILLTCIITRSFKEFAYLFIHGTLLPLIVPIVVQFSIFLIMDWVLFYYELITPLSMQLVNVISQMLFLLFTPYVINLNIYRHKFKYMKEDLNIAYLARQRSTLLKDFEV